MFPHTGSRARGYVLLEAKSRDARRLRGGMEEIEHVVRKPADRVHQTPILLLHGSWHGAWCWENWLGHFSSMGYEVHAFSLPGHGTSSCRKGHINFYTLGDYVNTLAAQVAQISPTPVVVGHSLGGADVTPIFRSRTDLE